jgi:sodium transport system permease protein
MLLVFVPLKVQLWMMLIPTFGQQLLINQVMRGEALDLLYLAVSMVTTLLMGVALVAVAIRMYSHEQFVFGR